MDLPGVSGVSSSQNKRRYIDDEDDDSDSDYSIDLESSGDSEDSWESQSFESESEDSSDDGKIENARKWMKINMNNIPKAPPRFKFLGDPKVLADVSVNDSPLTFFSLFVDDELQNLVVNETNRYASQHVSAKTRKHKSWRPTNVDEIMLFLALMFLQSIVKKPEQHLYWSRRQSINTPQFSKIMPRDRFYLLMRNLHFVDNNTYDPSTHPCSKLWKIYDVIEHFRKKFCEILNPEEQLSVDESLMLYKGRLSWKQYMPLKRSRFGIKFFMICEASSGYICDFILYTGKGMPLLQEYSAYPQSTAVVLQLLHRFLNKGFCVTVDNYYMSPLLADILLEKRTDIYGTLRSNRKDLPPGFAKEKVAKGQCIAYQRGKIMVLKWNDKKLVNMLSSFHDASSVSVRPGTTREKQKPKVVYDYNFTMGGVDRCDQEMSYYPSTRKQQRKYYKTIFRHLLDQAMWNSYVVYKKVTETKKSLLDFKLAVVEEIFDKHSSAICSSTRSSDTSISSMRLVEKHFASHIPSNPIKKEPRRQCAVCCARKDKNGKKIRKETRIWCEDCRIGLCLEPCFKIYHTQKNFV